MIWEMQVCEVAVRTESEAWVCTEQQLPLVQGAGVWFGLWDTGTVEQAQDWSLELG